MTTTTTTTRTINGNHYEIKPYSNLYGADLYGANLSSANLCGADLRGADLYGANLYGADLRGANLYGADLYGANLYGADLRGANLRGADLSSVSLSSANLRGADLTGAKLPRFQIPQEGELIVYKKLSGGVIAKLRVPPNARRTATPIGRKCRAEFVEVLEIFRESTCFHGKNVSKHDGKTIYRVGDTVYPDKYDDDIRVECTNGIHFFLTREEAEEY